MKQFSVRKGISLQIFAGVLTLLVFGQTIFAQNQTQSPERGFSPGKSYSLSGIETISMESGNLMLNVPLGGLPAGRGGTSAGVGLNYNSKLWDAKEGEVPDQHGIDQPSNALNVNIKDGGWRYNYLHRIEFDNNPGTNGYDFYSFIVMPDGSRHALWVAGYTNGFSASRVKPDGTDTSGSAGWSQVITGTVVLFTTDGTYLRIEVTTDSDGDYTNNKWVLYSPDGTRIVHDPAIGGGVVERIFDRNGNFIDVIETVADASYNNHRTTYIKDQLGRKVVIEYNAATGSGMDQDYIHTLGFNGTDVVTKVEWKTITVRKHYAMADFAIQNGIDYRNRPITQAFRVVNKVYLPTPDNGSFNYNLNYNFDYNADATSNPSIGWGEVSKVTLPSGASGSYVYDHDNETANLSADVVIANRPLQKTLAYNLEYDGSVIPTSEVWTYAVSYENNNTEILSTTSITGPDGGVTTDFYKKVNNGYTEEPEVVKTTMPDGSVVEKYYQGNAPCEPSFLSGRANRFPKYEYVSIRNAAGALTKTVIKEYSRDKNGNVTEVRDYDFSSYSTVPRDSYGKPNGLPSLITPARISRTEYYNDVPDSASTDYTDADSYHLAGGARLRSLPKSAEVQTGGGTPQTRSEMSYDYTTYTTNTKGGNLTESKAWDSFKGGTAQGYSNPLTSTNSISTSAQYDQYGNPTLTKDAKDVETTITYGNISTPGGYVTGLYPTKIEAASNYSALKRTSTTDYDFYTGLVTTATDVDNNVSSATEYDALGRPTKTAAAVGTASEIWTQTVYDDVNRMVIAKADLFTKGDAKKVAAQFYDQLGRVRLSKTLEDSSIQSATNETDGIKVQSRYSSSGVCTYDSTKTCSFQVTSNPYRAATLSAASGEPSMGWTRSQAQNTGKHSEMETFSGETLPAPWGSNANSTGKVKTDTDAERTLVTDQAGKQRMSRLNALGQLTDVWEITAAETGITEAISFGSLNLNGYKTSYEYDAQNNLTLVKQGTQQANRQFSYSSLSRLKNAVNPESGTIAYIYDNNGNLTGKTDARPVTTAYTYDELNRVKTRTYSDNVTPHVTYTYDNKGHLMKVENANSTTEYTEFDILGRIKKSKQTTDGMAYPEMEYTYNLSGALVEEKYPSGRIVKNVLDTDGDLAIVQCKKNSNSGYWNYADSFTYTAAGAVSSMQMGNGKWESTVFNSRLQPTQIALGTLQNGTDKLKLNFAYNTTGQNDNNGNVVSQTITVPTETRGSSTYAGFTATQAYAYDSLNRLKSAEETIPSQIGWKQTFTYDRFGNRTFDEGGTSSNYLTTTLARGCSTSTSNPNGICNKKEANPIIEPSTNRIKEDQDADAVKDYDYDVSGNTKKQANGLTFIYDGENKQIEVKNASSVSIGKYFYDGDGKRVKKETLAETTIFVYNAGGQLVAEYSTQISATPQVSYLTSDHLGSPRINTDANGAVISRHDYQPFGEEIQRTSYGNDQVRKKFTSYERDYETDLDFAQARMYANKLGRFTTTDPIYFQRDMVVDPQRFNLYVYTRSNPLKWIDPFGEEVKVAQGSSRSELYELVGGQANFDQYFQVGDDGLINKREGVDISKANQGVQFLNQLVGRDQTFLVYLGADANAVARLFAGTTNSDGSLNNKGRKISDRFRQNGSIVGTHGRPNIEQPNGEIFTVLAINPAVYNDNQIGTGSYGVETETLQTGVGQRVRAVSLLIHELAENLDFSINGTGAGNPEPDIKLFKKKATRELFMRQQALYNGAVDYSRAHKYAISREIQIRRDLTTINGGFGGGDLKKQ